jgi:twitching motility protein PilU
VEVMMQSPFISDLIAKGEIAAIKEVMGHSSGAGMVTFDQALYALFAQGRISQDEALHNADSRTDLSLRIRLSAGVNPQETGDLSIDTSVPPGVPHQHFTR